MPDHLLTKLRVATRAICDEVLISESGPTDGRSILESVAGWQCHEQVFLPQRNDVAVCRVGRIVHEGHVKFPVLLRPDRRGPGLRRTRLSHQNTFPNMLGA